MGQRSGGRTNLKLECTSGLQIGDNISNVKGLGSDGPRVGGGSRAGKGEESCLQDDLGALEAGTSDRCSEHVLAVQESGPSGYY